MDELERLKFKHYELELETDEIFRNSFFDDYFDSDYLSNVFAFLFSELNKHNGIDRNTVSQILNKTISEFKIKVQSRIDNTFLSENNEEIITNYNKWIKDNSQKLIEIKETYNENDCLSFCLEFKPFDVECYLSNSEDVKLLFSKHNYFEMKKRIKGEFNKEKLKQFLLQMVYNDYCLLNEICLQNLNNVIFDEFNNYYILERFVFDSLKKQDNIFYRFLAKTESSHFKIRNHYVYK